MSVIVRNLRGKWQVMKVYPNGRQAVVGSYTARYRAEEHASQLREEVR
jgi:hypothetical protein